MQVVRIDTRGRVLEGVAHLSLGANENLMWVALGNGGPWKITFDKPGGGAPGFVAGSPFDQVEYYVQRGSFGCTQNGLRPGVAINQTYKYRVRDANNPNNITHDPDVDIDG